MLVCAAQRLEDEKKQVRKFNLLSRRRAKYFK
jgi:hypothetical protein